MYEYLNNLNKEQRDAATTIDGRVLILAGAGTGKTTTLISRVAYMIDTGIDPESILLLTFTNKAAKEMQLRASQMIGENANLITACTFHSFCASFVRKYAPVINLRRDFEILDSPDTLDAMTIAYQEFINDKKKEGIEYKNNKDFPSKQMILKIHETAVNNCADVDSTISCFGLQGYNEEIKEIIRLFTVYKWERNLLDYDDLLLYTKQILVYCDDIRFDTDYKYQYVSCDEYQDTNTIQNDILDLITYQSPNLCVVGDDNQSIYAFRCADIRNILSFDKRYPDCKTIVLKENYRSTQKILDLANIIMDYATEGIPKKLHGQFDGDLPTLVPTRNDKEEAEYICDKIIKYHYNDNIDFKNMAVIIRSARQSYYLETLLNNQCIPFKKFGGLKFMEHASVKDTLAFLRVASNEKDELAWFRILQLYTGIGKTYSKRIADAIVKNDINQLDSLYQNKSFSTFLSEIKKAIEKIRTLSLLDALKYILEDYYPMVKERSINAMKITEGAKLELLFNIRGDIEDAKALYDMSKRHRTISGFLADIVLDATTEENNDDILNVTTIHSAKGLEYDVVFLMDVIDGITPKCPKGDDEDPEELRCLYVAITRAKKKLYLMAPRYNPIVRGSCILSHFINEDDIIDSMHIENNENIDSLRKIYDYKSWY